MDMILEVLHGKAIPSHKNHAYHQKSECLFMKKFILVFLFLLINLSIAAAPTDLNFNDVKANSTKHPLVKGKFKIIQLSDANNALKIYSTDKSDSGKVQIPLNLSKASDSKFKLSCDVKVSTTATPAGKLLAISNWDTNDELFRIQLGAGKLQLKATKFQNGRLVASNICTYKSNNWMTIELIVDNNNGNCKVSIIDKATKISLYKSTHTINKKFKGVYLTSSVWPGQSKDGYSYEFDNIKVTPLK